MKQFEEYTDYELVQLDAQGIKLNWIEFDYDYFDTSWADKKD